MLTNIPTENQGEFLLYRSETGNIKVDVYFQNETVWLTQKALAELFGVQRPAISKHLKNIFDSKELVADSVCSILEHTADDGKNYRTQYYNIDAIIAVGYRVNSYQARIILMNYWNGSVKFVPVNDDFIERSLIYMC